MCGIAGFWSNHARARDSLPYMAATLSHRGPDAGGCYLDGPVGLGHRRLSIIDIEGSHQPMISADGSIALVFNVEIYNFRELRRALEDAGHRFVTRGDGEVLLHCWQVRGERMLEMLNGMFAFALWDRQRQELFLARDHLGVKPLYFAWQNGSFVFGSEIKSLLSFPGMPREIDLDALGLYLECQYIPAPYSVYRAIRKLEAGHWISVRRGELRTGCYWKPSYVPKAKLDTPTAVDALDRGLRRSIESMLVSDVPVGVFVSGGVDSGLVAALANKISGGSIDTFNLGFTGHEVGSEHEHAARIGRHIGSKHHCLMLEPRDVLVGIDRWVDLFDEPFGDHAALPTMALAKYARETVKVVLTGEGADEVLGGYDNYAKRIREEHFTRILGARGSPLPWILRRLPGRLIRDRVLKAATEPISRRYTTIPNIFDSVLRRHYFTRSFCAATQLNLADRAEAFYDECDSQSYLDHLLNIDTRLWLADDLLAKVDRATMAFSLEARVPYLDQDLFDWCAHLDAPLKVSGGGIAKILVKTLAKRYLPKDIVYRPKQGFTMPLDRWITNELKVDITHALGVDGIQRRGLIRAPAINRMFNEHFGGRKNHATRLWTLFVLERWFLRYEPDFVL
jgi:asparagine synthase (glutamine-hydrolysing)